MKKYEEKVSKMLKSASTVEHDTKTIRKISYKAKSECNSCIEPKINVNKAERLQSIEPKQVNSYVR